MHDADCVFCKRTWDACLKIVLFAFNSRSSPESHKSRSAQSFVSRPPPTLATRLRLSALVLFIVLPQLAAQSDFFHHASSKFISASKENRLYPASLFRLLCSQIFKFSFLSAQANQFTMEHLLIPLQSVLQLSQSLISQPADKPSIDASLSTICADLDESDTFLVSVLYHQNSGQLLHGQLFLALTELSQNHPLHIHYIHWHLSTTLVYLIYIKA